MASPPLLGALAGEGHAPAADVPMVKGTPQAGGVPTVHGTPSTPGGQIAPHAAMESAQQPSTAAEPHPPPHAPAGVRPQQLHAPAGVRPQPVHRPVRSPGRIAARWAISSVGTLIVIVGILAAITLSHSPALSLSGGQNVTPGATLHLHGAGFVPGGSVTFTLDHRQPLRIVQRSSTQEAFHSSAATVLQVLAARKGGAGYLSTRQDALVPILSSSSVQAGLSGTFDVAIVVDQSRSSGSHTISATESFILIRSADVTVGVIALQPPPPPPPPPLPPPPPPPPPPTTTTTTTHIGCSSEGSACRRPGEGSQPGVLVRPCEEEECRQFGVVLVERSPGEGSPGEGWQGEGSPGAGWQGEGSPGAGWHSEGSPGAGSPSEKPSIRSSFAGSP